MTVFALALILTAWDAGIDTLEDVGDDESRAGTLIVRVAGLQSSEVRATEFQEG